MGVSYTEEEHEKCKEITKKIVNVMMDEIKKEKNLNNQDKYLMELRSFGMAFAGIIVTQYLSLKNPISFDEFYRYCIGHINIPLEQMTEMAKITFGHKTNA